MIGTTRPFPSPGLSRKPVWGDEMPTGDRNGEIQMADAIFLTADEVAERYRGEVSVGTLRNWRAQRLGPPFVKIGKSVLYPVQGLDEWDKKNLVVCRASRKLGVVESEQE